MSNAIGLAMTILVIAFLVIVTVVDIRDHNRKPKTDKRRKPIAWFDIRSTHVIRSIVFQARDYSSRH
jgi:hypothetical protein